MVSSGVLFNNVVMFLIKMMLDGYIAFLLMITDSVIGFSKI